MLARLTLSPDEQATVYDAAVPTDTRLFDVMDRLHVIRDESLLVDAASADVRSTAGDDIRRAASGHLDAAYRRLERWCALELRQQPQEGTAAGALLREALARLAAREDLFRGVLRVFSDMRAEQLPQMFLRALKSGAGGARPIEVHAHDAPRYVADMLAWVHQALAGERELLMSMLGRLGVEERRRIGERHVGAPGDAHGALVSDILGRNIAGCSHALRVRVAHTLELAQDSVTALRLAHIVKFYHATMAHTLGERAALSAVLAELCDAAHGTFVAALERHVASVADVQAGAATLRELLAERARSAADDGVLGDLCTYLVRPLHARACRQEAAQQWALSSLFGRRAAPDDAVQLNALDALLAVLRTDAALADECDAVRTDAVRRAEAIRDSVYAEMLAASGIEALDAKKAQLDAFLASPELLIPESLGMLARPALRAAIHRAARTRLADAYAKNYSTLNNYDALPEPSQVAVLLDVGDSDLASAFQ